MITLERKGKNVKYYHYDKYEDFKKHEREMEEKGWICFSSYEENNEDWEYNASFLNSNPSISIEEMFQYFMGKTAEVFDENGYFVGKVWQYCRKVAHKFFCDDIDALDRLCFDAHCFKDYNERFE